MLEATGKFNDRSPGAGILLAAQCLKPSSRGEPMALDGPRRTVIDGPLGRRRN
jgi:hypothetical protein